MSRALPLPRLDPGATLDSNARQVLHVRVDDLFRYGPIVGDPEAVEPLHDARIAAKRLRYTLELFRLLFADDVAHPIEQLKALQEELGQLHDHDVRIALIDEELSALRSRKGKKASAMRPGLEALLQRERVARANRHTSVVEHWARLTGAHVQETLLALSGTTV